MKTGKKFLVGLFCVAIIVGLAIPVSPVALADDPPVIVVYGDSRTGHSTHQQVVDAVVAMNPTAVFHTGDLVENGLNPDHWAVFNSIVSELVGTAEFYPALGNHELGSQLFFDNFDLPNNERWYSVDINSIHFVVLDSNSPTDDGSEQYEWLQADLYNIADETGFIIVVLHHPPFSTGPHVEDEKGLRQSIVPLLEQHGVDAVFSGHDHTYERSVYNDIFYVVTGGGGAPLYDQARTSPYSQLYVKAHHFCTISTSDGQLTVSVFDVNSSLLDQFVIDEEDDDSPSGGGYFIVTAIAGSLALVSVALLVWLSRRRGKGSEYS
jgi:3',5'-cyclic AMP phosphodiesterase CpdA